MNLLRRRTGLGVVVLLVGVLLALSVRGRPLLAAEAAKGAESKFELRSLSLKSGAVILLRLNTADGTTWTSTWDGEAKRMKWTQFNEPQPPGPGDYDIVLIPKSDDVYLAYRFDRRSGRMWSLDNSLWNPVADPQ